MLRRVFLLLTIIACYLAVLPSGSAAQVGTTKAEPVHKNVSALLALSKSPARLIEIMSQREQEALGLRYAPGGDPCEIARPIGYGETVNGSLFGDDCPLGDGTYFDFYLFDGVQGDQVTIDMTSTEFDAYAGVGNEFDFFMEDDDSGGGTNARIVATLPTTGLYVIIANSAVPASGYYQLKLNKTPACTFSLSPASVEVPGIGGTFDFSVDTQPGCYWTAVSNDPWRIQMINDGSLQFGVIHHRGSGTLGYSINLNENDAPYSGSIAVAGQTFNITQNALVCSYAISPTSVTVPGTQTSGQLSVDTPAGCPWTASSSDYRLSFDSSAIRRGPGTITYTAHGNYGPTDRVFTALIGGQPFTVTQTGLNCTYSLSTTTITTPAEETSGTFRVTTQPGCVWGIGDSPFAVFDHLNTVGTKDVWYMFFENPFVAPRSGSIYFNGGGVFSTQINLVQSGVIPQPITITGRVVDPNGAGLRNATVTLLDFNTNATRTVTTTSFGYYSFDNVMTGYQYLLGVKSKRYRFFSRQEIARTNMESVDFVGAE